MHRFLDLRAGSPDTLHVSVVLLPQIIEVDRIVGFKYRRSVSSAKFAEYAHFWRALWRPLQTAVIGASARVLEIIKVD